MKVPPSSPPHIKPEMRQTPVRSRENVDPKIREAAEGLEAIFLNTMLQAMRGTVESSELSLENSATKLYRGMLDSEIAQTTARNNSVGLADQIIAYLDQRSYTVTTASPQGRMKPVADPAPPSVSTVSKEVRTGGTDESESIR